MKSLFIESALQLIDSLKKGVVDYSTFPLFWKGFEIFQQRSLLIENSGDHKALLSGQTSAVILSS